MTDKSHVGMEMKLCPVCREQHPVGVLLDRKLRDTLSRQTLTGMKLCPAHQAIADEGRVWIIEIDPEHSTLNDDGYIADSGTVHFLAGVACIKDEAYDTIINIPMTKERVMFTNSEGFNALMKLTGGTLDDDDVMKLDPKNRMNG